MKILMQELTAGVWAGVNLDNMTDFDYRSSSDKSKTKLTIYFPYRTEDGELSSVEFTGATAVRGFQYLAKCEAANE